MPYLAAANLLLLEVNFCRKAANKQHLKVLIDASLHNTRAHITCFLAILAHRVL